MSYDEPSGSIKNKGEEDLYQAVVPQLTVQDFVTSVPGSPSPGDAYIVDSSLSGSVASDRAIRFNPAETDYVEIPSASPWNNWDGITSFTITVFFSSTNTSRDQKIFTTQPDTSTTERVEGKVFSNGNIQFALRDTSGDRHIIEFSHGEDVLDGDRKALTFRYDSDEFNSTEALQVFVNGASGDVVNEIRDSKIGQVSSGKFFLGYNGNFGDTERPDADMRELRIYDAALGVETIRNRTRKMITGRENNIAGYWPLTNLRSGNFDDLTSDGTSNNPFFGFKNHATNNGTDVVVDGINLGYQGRLNKQSSFEDGNSLPFLRLSDRPKAFNESNVGFANAIDGEWVFGQANQTEDDGRQAVLTHVDGLELSNGEQIDEFSFYFNENSYQYGNAVRLRNTNGTYETAFATNNPQWVLDDGTGSTEQIYSGDGTERWVFVEFKFDWANNEYGYFIEDQQSGTIRQGTRNLVSGNNIASVELWTYNNGSFGPTINYQMVYDLFTVKNSVAFEGFADNIAIYNGTSWQFFNPEKIGNPRAFIQSLDKIYRWHNGSWDEINVSGTGTSSDSVIQRIESGSLPSNPTDNDAVIDARYSDIEWLRVYNGNTSTWELEGTGNTIYRVDDKNFHWEEGDLDTGLVVTNDTLELDTV